MKTKIIECTDGSFYGKFLVGQFTEEWFRKSNVNPLRRPLLMQEGWGPRHLLVLDLSSTGAGAIFYVTPSGVPERDIDSKGLAGIL